MTILETSIAIVGSGMGGATTAYGLAQAGIDCLVIERGDFVKKEDANWSAREIFINQKYKTNEKWLDEKGKSFTPSVHYIVGGNTKVYSSSLPRFRESDFQEIKHKEGTSPAWPFTYQDLEPYYCQAEQLYKVHGTSVAGNDPKLSVVDQYYKAHDVENLYLIDGGFFPSSAAMNPALTIAAQALRVVDKSGLKQFN